MLDVRPLSDQVIHCLWAGSSLGLGWEQVLTSAETAQKSGVSPEIPKLDLPAACAQRLASRPCNPAHSRRFLSRRPKGEDRAKECRMNCALALKLGKQSNQH